MDQAVGKDLVPWIIFDVFEKKRDLSLARHRAQLIFPIYLLINSAQLATLLKAIDETSHVHQ
jgi:hypothetical protein